MAACSDRFQFEVEWKAFMLRPDHSTAGLPKEEVMAERFGSVEAYRQKADQLKQVFASEGITFNPDGQRTGSSINSHRMVVLAARHDKQDQIMDELFQRYTTGQQWIGDPEVCIGAAVSVGIDEKQARDWIQDPESGMHEVQQDLSLGRQLGVHGVPFFVINDKIGLSGAQDVEALIEAFEQV